MEKRYEKRYYWLKLPENFFETEQIAWLEEQANGIAYSNFYLKLCLKSINNQGVLVRKVGTLLIPYNTKKLAEMTHTPEDTVIIAMGLLQKIGLITILENGELYLNQVKEMIGNESASTKRSRKCRAKKKALQCNVTATPLQLENNTTATPMQHQCNLKASLDNREQILDIKTTTNNSAVVVNIKDRLKLLGINNKATETLLKNYSSNLLLKKIPLLEKAIEKGNKILNPIGYIKKAIEEDWKLEQPIKDAEQAQNKLTSIQNTQKKELENNFNKLLNNFDIP